MEDANQNYTQQLLAEAERFCKVIEPYIDLLGLSRRKVNAFKNDVHVLKHLTESNEGFTQDFISYNIVSVQSGLNNLIIECTLSSEFNSDISEQLGIQNPWENATRRQTNFKVKWSRPITDVRDLPGTKLV